MFIDDRSLAVDGADPDVYVRPNGEVSSSQVQSQILSPKMWRHGMTKVYLSGEAIMHHPIPPEPRDIVPSDKCVRRLQRIAASVSAQLTTEIGLLHVAASR